MNNGHDTHHWRSLWTAGESQPRGKDSEFTRVAPRFYVDEGLLPPLPRPDYLPKVNSEIIPISKSRV